VASVGAAAAVLGLVVGVEGTQPASAAIDKATCKDVLFYGARGSGQKAADNQGFGPQVANVRDRVVRGLGGRRDVYAEPVDYDPNSVAVLGKPLIGIYQFVANLGFGVDLAYSELTLRKVTCPNERIVLAGYSQGAMVMHRVVQRLVNANETGILSRIDGVIMLADGDHNPNDNVTTYGSASAAARGVGFVFSAAARTDTTKLPASMRSRLHSSCTAQDVVCDDAAVAGRAALVGTVRAYRNGVAVHLGPTYLGSDANVTRPVGAVVGRVLSMPRPVQPGGGSQGGTTPGGNPGGSPGGGQPGGEPVPTHAEQSGSMGSPTFTNPYNASGPGPRIPAMSTVQVTCRVYAPAIASANPDGWWYRIASSPWSNQYYAVANTFWNGDVPGRKPYTHNTDFAVPIC
jgi:hypothetical protein